MCLTKEKIGFSLGICSYNIAHWCHILNTTSFQPQPPVTPPLSSSIICMNGWHKISTIAPGHKATAALTAAAIFSPVFSPSNALLAWPEAVSQAKPGHDNGFIVALAWPAMLKSQSQAMKPGAFCIHI